MKQLILLAAAIAIVGTASSEASAQRLLQRIFGARGTVSSNHSTQSQFTISNSPYPIPQPAYGYGSNLHRNFTIKQAQQKAAATGIQPKYRGNVRWLP